MTLLHLISSHTTLCKLLAELQAALDKKLISRPIIRDSEARQLPYLQACIKEGLRLYPPVTGMLSKQVPPEGDMIDDKFVPGGTSIGWNSYGMQRQKDNFGLDADVFRPERWVDEKNEAKLQRVSDTVSLVFGAGRFGCLGKPVAMMELNKIIPEAVLRYEWQTINIERPFEGVCIGFFLHEGMWVRVEERKPHGQDFVDSPAVGNGRLSNGSAMLNDAVTA